MKHKDVMFHDLVRRMGWRWKRLPPVEAWEAAARDALRCHLDDPAEVERFIAEVRGNPAAGFMTFDQLTGLACEKLHRRHLTERRV